MPSLILSNPLGADAAESIGLARREYTVGESIVVDDVSVGRALIRAGYATSTDPALAPGPDRVYQTGEPMTRSLVLSNPLDAGDAQRIGLVNRAYAVGELIHVDEYVASVLIRTGYAVPGDGSITAALLVGDGPPTQETGANGQWYLDSLNQVLYGPKTNGAWPTGVIRPGRSISTVTINGAGQLVISYVDGTSVNLGSVRGPAGPAGAITAATVTSLPSGADPTVELGGTPEARTIALGIPAGPRGDQGLQGPSGTIASATATGLAAGAAPTVTLGGTAQARTLAFGLPKGDQGIKGDRGDQGVQGPSGTITSATAAALAAGAAPTVELGGTPQARTLALGIPAGARGDQGIKGDRGDQGVQGPSGTITSATATGLAAGVAPTVTLGGTPEARTVALGIPAGAQGERGIQGGKGDQGPAGTITSATATGLAAGAAPTVTLGGTPEARTVALGIPKGDKGDKGDQGDQGPVGGAAPDATSTASGSVRLAGDLGGTAAEPMVVKGGNHGHAANQISDSTTVGRAVLTAADGAAARTAIGAGTSSLALGTTATTAAAGNDSRLSDARTPTAHTHTAAQVSDASTVGRSVLTAADGAAARTAIGAGTSSLALGTTAGTAAAGNDSRLSDARTPTAHTHTAAQVSDSSAVGRSVLTAVDAPAARTAIGAGTSSLVLGTTAGTAAAGNDSRLSDARPPTAHGHGAGDLTDASATGLAVVRAVDPAAARTAIGAGTSSLALGTTAGTAAAGNDARLSDARTPTAHTHTSAQITDATAAATASTVMVRDGAGRAQVAAPAVPADIARLDTVTAAVAAGSRLTLRTATAEGITLAVADENKLVPCTNTTPITVTVPTNATAAFPVGSIVHVWQAGTAAVTIGAAAGVTLQAPAGMLTTTSQHAVLRLIKSGTDTWIVSGSGSGTGTGGAASDQGIVTVDDSATAFGISITSNWGVTDAGAIYYDSAGAAEAEAGLLVPDPLNDAFAVFRPGAPWTPTGVLSVNGKTGIVDLTGDLDAAAASGRRRPVRLRDASFTLSLDDAGAFISVYSASPSTLTVPADADVPFPLGTVIEVAQTHNGKVTIAPATGVTLATSTGQTVTAGLGATVRLVKTSAGLWRISGDLSDDTGWIALPVNSGFTTGTNATRYRVLRGVVHLQVNVNGTWAANTVVTTLPVGARPVGIIPWLFGVMFGNVITPIKIDNNGDVMIALAGNSTGLLCTVSFLNS